jgi:hypothetical protein
MSEPIVTNQPIEPSPEAAELAILRQAHTEVLRRRQKDRARIAELESGAIEMQAKLASASESLHQATIGGPLKTMCESMSNVPEMFQEQFSKHYAVALIEGKLALQTLDGKPVHGKDGKPIPFERDALAAMLTTGDDARARTFKAITITNRASGGAGNVQGQHKSLGKKTPTYQFGLK